MSLVHEAGAEDMYFSVDVEADGPVPGLHSMLSIGIVALHPDHVTEESVFYEVLETLPGATQNPETMEWWSGFPAQFVEARANPVHPHLVMIGIDCWVRGQVARMEGLLGRKFKPVFVAYPAVFDFAFYAYYAHRFAGRSVFGFSALDMASVAMGMLGGHYNQQGRSVWPDYWVTEQNKVAKHNALGDARQQAEMFREIVTGLRVANAARAAPAKEFLESLAQSGHLPKKAET